MVANTEYRFRNIELLNNVNIDSHDQFLFGEWTIFPKLNNLSTE